jgi:hypothetical protein
MGTARRNPPLLGSAPPPGGTGRPVLQDDAFVERLFADAVGFGVVLLLLRCVARGELITN